MATTHPARQPRRRPRSLTPCTPEAAADEPHATADPNRAGPSTNKNQVGPESPAAQTWDTLDGRMYCPRAYSAQAAVVERYGLDPGTGLTRMTFTSAHRFVPMRLTAHSPGRRWWVPGPVAQLLIMVLMAARRARGVVGGEINDTVVIAAVGTTVKVDTRADGIGRGRPHTEDRGPRARQVGEHRPHSAKRQVGSAPASEKPRKPLTKPISRIMLPWRASGPHVEPRARTGVAWPGDPDARMRDVAEAVGITERAVQLIVRDLVAQGTCARTRWVAATSTRFVRKGALPPRAGGHVTLGKFVGLVVDAS